MANSKDKGGAKVEGLVIGGMTSGTVKVGGKQVDIDKGGKPQDRPAKR